MKKKKKVNKKKNTNQKNQLPPQYKQQVEQLTAMAMTIIHSEESAIEQQQLPEAYKEAQQTVQHQEDMGPKAVADVALWALAQVEKEAGRRGKRITPIIVMGVIGEITAQVAEVATMAGLFELTEEDIQVAISTAVNKYIVQAKKEGTLNDQQLQEAGQALHKAFPEEAEQFGKMITERQKRQQESGPQQPPQQAPPQEQPPQEQPPQGLLGGR